MTLRKAGKPWSYRKNAERLSKENSEKRQSGGEGRSQRKDFVFRVRKLCYNAYGMSNKLLTRTEEKSMNAKLVGFFSGFPTRHFTDDIAKVLKEELAERDSLVFISTWPDNFAQNDEDSHGMHNMFAERNMPFAKHSVIDNRTKADEAVRLIREASCIFLMGGNATMQFDLMRRKGILDEIRKSSAVILGVSAGSMNMGTKVVDIYESLTPYEGLGFADLTIKAHYPLEEDLLQAVKQVSMELPVCLMTDESAIFVKKDSVMQIGKINRMVKGEISEFTQKEW